ncbi:MAG: DUF6089 family protein [Bacteroidetes bacterium]|nr:DUF6089 family protein [Bacteroidota bacterium]
MLTVFFISSNCFAQFHEVGLFLGGSNYIGDIGTDRYIDPNSPAIGLLYKWNVTNRYSLRGGFTLTKLVETEYNNSDINRFNRSYKVDKSIQEAIVGIEVNFKEFNLHDADFNFTPYFFYGISYFRYEQYFITPRGPFSPPTYNNYGKDEKIAVPFTLGVKLNPNPLFILGFELGARYTLTDNLDGSNPENEYANELGYKFGNVANNDWYVFMGFTISFTFGDLPCYCKE